MINNFLITIYQSICQAIWRIIDALYRICVRLLYHSKVVGVLIVFLFVVFFTSMGFYLSILEEIKNRQYNEIGASGPYDPSGFYVIDVGQGDSLLYITKENQTFLIDTGKPGDGIVQKLEKILGKYRKKIDVILLTHPDSDHVGEINNILTSFNVGLILYSPIYDARADSKKSIDEIKNKIVGASKDFSSKVIPVFAGSNLVFSENEKTYFLSPSFSGMMTFANKKEVAEDNYFSVVAMIKNKDLIFTTSDAPQKIEKVLAPSNDGLFPELTNLTGEVFERSQFDKIILKVGHHGSKTSSAPDFIRKLSPTDAVLSYGIKNRYGHPNQEVLDLFSSSPSTTPPKIKIHRTISGTVYFGE